MIAVLGQATRRYRGQIIGWGLATLLLCILVVPFYDIFYENRASFEELLKKYPPQVMAFFGDMTQMFTPGGYLQVELFSYLPLVVCVFALLIGSGLVVADEEKGTLDLLLAQPVSRTRTFFGRLAAAVLVQIVVLAIGWAALTAASRPTRLNLPPPTMARPFVSLLALMLFFMGLGLVLSLILPSRRAASMTTGIALTVSYFITSLARIDSRLDRAADFSPFSYYQGGAALDGLNLRSLASLGGVGAVLAIVAWRLFVARDIRVAGEGSWGRPRWRPWRRPSNA